MSLTCAITRKPDLTPEKSNPREREGKTMAKAKSKGGVDSTIPDDVSGWDDYSSGSGEDILYVVKGVGKACQGVIQSYKPGKGNKAGKLAIKLTKPCDAVKYSGDGEERESEEVTAEPGDVVMLDANKALEDVTGQIGKEIFAKYVEKVDLDSGGTFWRMIVKVKPGAKPKADDNDIPF